jgi:flagellar basal body-associated protein FliL
MIIAILSSKKLAEVHSPEDREFIKDEIRFALNEHLTTGEILQVYFTSFIIQ